MCACLLCISTSFRVYAGSRLAFACWPALKSSLKHSFSNILKNFTWFLTEILWKMFKKKKKGWKRMKKVFQPAFGYIQQPKAGQNIQHLSFCQGHEQQQRQLFSEDKWKYLFFFLRLQWEKEWNICDIQSVSPFCILTSTFERMEWLVIPNLRNIGELLS